MVLLVLLVATLVVQNQRTIDRQRASEQAKQSQADSQGVEKALQALNYQACVYYTHHHRVVPLSLQDVLTYSPEAALTIPEGTVYTLNPEGGWTITNGTKVVSWRP